MSDYVFPYWDERKWGDDKHVASGKSLADRDGLESQPLSDEEAKNLQDFLESDDYQQWQLEIMENEYRHWADTEELKQQQKIGDSKMSETKDKQFYAVIDVRKLELVSPTEGQLMSYYTDYGYTNIEDVINDYGKDEMIREWYNNTNWTEQFSEHREKSNIYWIDSEKEYEEVTMIPKEECERLRQLNYGY